MRILLLAAALAQGPNFTLPPDEIELRLQEQPFEVVGMQDNRWEGDRTQRTAIRFRDGTRMRVKWARAAPGGGELNNQPRYELAAYRIQKLFLDPGDHVVPPTALREIPLAAYRQLDPDARPTFEGTRSVLVAIQYWLDSVDYIEAPDLDRAAADPGYARRLACLNLFTYLIRHVDSNPGNVLVSTIGEPRMFAVDNGVAFRSPESPRGTLWMSLHVDRLPADIVARIRALTRADLDAALAVVAEFRVRPDGRLESVPPGRRLEHHRGVHRTDDVIQFGLTRLELDELWARRQALLAQVDAGTITLF